MCDQICSKIEDLSTNDLHDLFTGAPITLLLGSSISKWEPSQLLSGEDFSKSLYDLIFKDDNNNYFEPSIDENILLPQFNQLPFEVINDRCPNKQQMHETLCDLYNKDSINPIHELVADLLKSCEIESIITPNYDTCLDYAIAKAFNSSINSQIGPIYRVIIKDDVPQNNLMNNQIYFKVHGSADQKQNMTLIYSLTQEGLLDSWKRPLIHHLINNHILFILGYSGKDFDLCQEISVAKPLKIIWNFYEKSSITPNAMLLANKGNMKIILGDMGDVLSKLYRPIKLIFSSYKENIVDILRLKFTIDERLLWQCKILNSLTYSLPVIELTERLKHNRTINVSSQIEFLSEQAASFSSHGQYKKSAINHIYTAKLIFCDKQNRDMIYQQLNAASDALRGYGDFIGSNLLHLINTIALKTRKIKSWNKSFSIEFGFQLIHNEVLLLQEFYRIAKIFKINPIQSIIRKSVEERIQKTASFIHASGNIYMHQQLKMWAIRFDISEDIFFKNDIVPSPSPEYGYKQLFFPIGMMMEFRYRLNEKLDPLNQEYLQIIYSHLRLARQLGISPEIWKLLTIIKKRFPNKFTNVDQLELEREFNNCEYTIIQKNIKKFFGY